MKKWVLANAWNIFITVLVVGVVGGITIFGYTENNADNACRKACHPDAWKRIDSVCHCGIEGGWRRNNE